MLTLKLAPLPSVGDDAALASNYERIQMLVTAIPPLLDARDLAKRKLDAIADELDIVDLKFRADRANAGDLRKAQARADEARTAYAKADAAHEDAVKELAAREAAVPELVAEARRAIAPQLMERYRSMVKEIAVEAVALAAKGAEAHRLAKHIEADFGGAIHAGALRR